MIRSIALALAGSTFLLANAALADPIEGNYRTPKTGATARVAPCGASFCMTYTSGDFKGKQFATMKPNGDGTYAGRLTDYTDGGKEYKGKAKIKGRDIVVEGCVLGGLICRGETFSRL
jgi:uncharacterized protein (DUF2147 family)